MKYYLLLIPFVLIACGQGISEKKELRKFSKLNSGTKFKLYKAASSRSIPLLISTYSSDKKAPLTITEEELRLLLSVVLSTTERHSFSIAENDLVLNKTTNNAFRFLAHTMRSSTMYEKGWPKIAAKEELKAESYRDTLGYLKSNRNLYLLSELIQAKKDIHKMAFTQAGNHFKTISDSCGIRWPMQLSEILATIEMGNTDRAKSLYNTFQNDTSIPYDIRTYTSLMVTKLLLKPSNLKKIDLLPSEYFYFLLTGLKTDKKMQVLFDLLDKLQ